MRQLSDLARIGLVSVILGMAVLAGYAFTLERKALQTLQEHSVDNISWNAMQLEAELYRFISALGRLKAGDETITADDVILRYDILWSRVALFEDGVVGERLRAYDQGGAIIQGLRSTLREQEESVMNLRAGDMSEVYALIIAFTYHEPRLRRFSVTVNAGENRKGAMFRAGIRDSQFMAVGLTTGTLLLTGMLLYAVFADSRRNRNLAAANARLAREADAANTAKSRFLSMMSHELRTPMNGVLGQLALAKSHGLPASAQKLVERAERSGRRLIAMLTDILDFAALQEHQLEIAAEPFEVAKLAKRIGELTTAPDAERGIPVTCSDHVPRAVTGDWRRIRHAISYLASYVQDTAAASHARLIIDHRSAELCITLSFLYDNAGDEDWRPNLLMGEADDLGDQFETEAFGPMIARLLIEAMGGRMELTELYAGQTAIAVFIPAQPVADTRPLVRLETASATMRLICQAALKGADVDIAEDDAASDRVRVAFLEPGADDQAEQIDRLKRDYPAARIIALGAPREPGAFDGIAPLPLEVNALRDVIHRESA